jgi:hypothetical protein
MYVGTPNVSGYPIAATYTLGRLTHLLPAHEMFRCMHYWSATRARTCACAHVCTYVRMHMHAHTHTHEAGTAHGLATHTHTHKHTHTHMQRPHPPPNKHGIGSCSRSHISHLCVARNLRGLGPRCLSRCAQLAPSMQYTLQRGLHLLRGFKVVGMAHTHDISHRSAGTCAGGGAPRGRHAGGMQRQRWVAPGSYSQWPSWMETYTRLHMHSCAMHRLGQCGAKAGMHTSARAGALQHLYYYPPRRQRAAAQGTGSRRWCWLAGGLRTQQWPPCVRCPPHSSSAANPPARSAAPRLGGARLQVDPCRQGSEGKSHRRGPATRECEAPPGQGRGGWRWLTMAHSRAALAVPPRGLWLKAARVLRGTYQCGAAG